MQSQPLQHWEINLSAKFKKSNFGISAHSVVCVLLAGSVKYEKCHSEVDPCIGLACPFVCVRVPKSQNVRKASW